MCFLKTKSATARPKLNQMLCLSSSSVACKKHVFCKLSAHADLKLEKPHGLASFGFVETESTPKAPSTHNHGQPEHPHTLHPST